MASRADWHSCTECEKNNVIENDYLCIGCRGKLDGRPICEYCGLEEYVTRETEPARSMLETRFRGLCEDCKKIAIESVPLMDKRCSAKHTLQWDERLRDWLWAR